MRTQAEAMLRELGIIEALRTLTSSRQDDMRCSPRFAERAIIRA